MGAILKNGVVYGGSVAQQQANWTESNPSSTSYIQNKPTLGTASSKDSTTTISDGGTDLPTAGAVYTALQNVHIDVDTTLDTTSDNPIANSAVATALNGKVDAVNGKGLSTNDYTDADQSKLSGIATGAEVNVQSNWSETDNSSDAYIQNKPTALSAFTNDSGFITNTVNNLTNYYTTSTTYTKTEVDNLISAAKNGRFEVVAILPTTDIQTNVIYLLPKTVSQTDNVYDEYINTDGTSAGWEKIGDTQIDLSNYVQKSSTTGLIKNDGTIDTNTYIQTSSTSGLVKNDGTIDTNSYATASSLSDYIQKSNTSGLVKNDGTIDTSKHVHLQPTGYSGLTGEVQAKTWNGYTPSGGQYIWTDGENIYYSQNNNQYVLDKSTSTWNTKSWNSSIYPHGTYIWTDKENIYYSNSNLQYVLDKTTSTWSEKTWSGLTSFDGDRIWTDGENIYFSNSSNQYVLNKSNSTWSAKTWTGLTSFYGYGIWTDGDNIYYSNYNTQYVLDKTTSTWSTKTWSGLTNFRGNRIWTDGENIYYSNGEDQYVLNKSNSTWSAKTWNELTSFDSTYIWTDGENIYYSYDNSTQYVFVAEPVYADGFVKSDGSIDTFPKQFIASTTDLEDGVSPLETGVIYLVYEDNA